MSLTPKFRKREESLLNCAPQQKNSLCSHDSPFMETLEEIFHECKKAQDGKQASYIPELANVPGHLFSVAIVTIDGQIYKLGESSYPFTIQSISKAFVYGLALEDHGVERVFEKVGVKPSSDPFNSILFDDAHNRPFNPMVNAGAIATTSLIKGESYEHRFSRILERFNALAGRELTVNEAVFASEKKTGHRNKAIGYMELSAGMIEEPVEEHLELYFRQCAIEATAPDLAVMAATLANNGVNPLTGEKVMDSEQVTSVFSVMTSCGMYDFSGDWLFRVGIPAKSGVGGGIIAVLPKQFGIGIFSPLLDSSGNSVRGIRFCEELSSRFRLHLFNIHSPLMTTIFRKYTGKTSTSKRQRLTRERDYLFDHGDEITILDLRGDLYFASMEQLIRETLSAEKTKFIIYEMKKILRIDQVAIELLVKLEEFLFSKGIILKLVHLQEEIFNILTSSGWNRSSSFYPSLDRALQDCEDYLLEHSPSFSKPSLPLSIGNMDLFQSFSPSELETLNPLVETVHYKKKDKIITEGEPADRFYLLAGGYATVVVKGTERLTTYIPGIAFGELALFEVGQRTASVVAETDVICYMITLQSLNALMESSPLVYVKILQVAGKSLVGTLQRVTRQLKGLSE